MMSVAIVSLLIGTVASQQVRGTTTRVTITFVLIYDVD